MLDLRKALLPPLCCTLVVASAPFAFARTIPERHHPVATDFDLSRHEKGKDEGRRYRVRKDGESPRFRKGDLGPYVTYNPVSGGPTLEFGALGAGRKGTPGLAHVGVDWSF
jgi:hypothetical protein